MDKIGGRTTIRCCIARKQVPKRRMELDGGNIESQASLIKNGMFWKKDADEKLDLLRRLRIGGHARNL